MTDIAPTALLDWPELPPELQARVRAVMEGLQLPSPCPMTLRALRAWLAQHEPMLAAPSPDDELDDDAADQTANSAAPAPDFA